MSVDATRANGWLLRPVEGDPATRLFCLPYLGAGASMYHRWPRRIGDVEVCLLQPPGRENRLLEPAYEAYGPFAEDLLAAIEPLLDRPYAIFAHCNSVFAAYVVAVRLAAAGHPPRRFFASSMVAPDEVPFGSLLDVPADRLPEVVAELVRARGVEPSPEIVELAMEAVEGDLRAYRGFGGAAPGSMPCPVTVLSWRGDRTVPPSLTAGWARFGRDRAVTLDGHHWAFLDPSPALLRVIDEDLAG
ncbi:thioesterase [Micromonospora sp. Llam7]|uniref:thioesterase II family protein n=1 Tax=Micromonospora tarapacensis TaxID=2835305 RepID=UPI001C83457B|nr:thioesterase domain-containing protein [Micromonospora tarapacensis]MBX7266323.1 thioesterase [Micromonospora tarapacensis]